MNKMLDKMEELRASLVTSGKLEVLVQQFQELQKQEKLEEMFYLIWKQEEVNQYLKIVKDDSNKKSESDAIKFRKIGNEYHEKKDLASALNNYNLSIMTAPHPEISDNGSLIFKKLKEDSVDFETYNELSLGYENRSAVLMELKQYDRAICDIDNAMKVNNTKNISYELLARKARCLISNNELKDANIILDMLISDSELERQVDKEIEKTMKSIHILKNMSKIAHESRPEETNHIKSNNQIPQYKTSDDLLFAYTNPDLPELDRHPTIPSFSNALKLCYTPEQGRFVVAQRDIKPGEVVAIEEAYSYCLNSDEISTQRNFCSTCLKRCAAPLPCTQCNKISFCSEQCRLKGWNSFHKKECQILPTILSLGFPAVNNLVQGLRIISKTSYLDLKDKVNKIRNKNKNISPLCKGFNEKGIYDSFSYEATYNLVGNIKERDPEFMIVICCWVFMVIEILIDSEQYYVDREGKPFTPKDEDIVLIGSCLLHHILSIYCNCFGVNETKINVLDGSVTTEKIGVGLFNTLSLFNHSCNPSVMNFTYGNTGVCYAIKFVPAGDEVTTKYGKMFCFDENVESRRYYLSKSYFFNCNCEACMNNWHVDSKKCPKLRPHKERIYRVRDNVQINENFSDENNDKLEDELEHIFELEYETEKCIESSKTGYNEFIPTLSKIIEFLDRFAIKPDVVNVRAQMNMVKCIRNKRPCYYFKRNVDAFL